MPKKICNIIWIVILVFFKMILSSSCLAADQKKWLVGFAQDTMGNDWRIAQVRSLEKAFASQPEVDFFYTDARGSTAQQIVDIEEMIAKNIDVLITSPRDVKAMDAVITRAYKQGIPVVLITRRIESDNFTIFIHPDDSKIAHQAASYMAVKLHGKGNVLILQGVPTSSTAIARTKAFSNVITDYPAIHIIAVKPANYLRGDAIMAVEEAIYEKLDFNAIYAQSDSMASGAIMALEKAGIDPGAYFITGIDFISEAKEAIKTGRQHASFTYPTGGVEGARMAMEILHCQNVPKEYIIESVMVTKDNVESVDPIF